MYTETRLKIERLFKENEAAVTIQRSMYRFWMNRRDFVLV